MANTTPTPTDVFDNIGGLIVPVDPMDESLGLGCDSCQHRPSGARRNGLPGGAPAHARTGRTHR
jgi:hypothetical protein